MKKIIFYIFIGFIPTLLFAQGKLAVLDESTKKPLQSATVHFSSLDGESKNKTFVGKTNIKGEVAFPFKGKQAIIITFVGYKSVFDTLDGAQNHKIYLKPTSIILNEIVTTGQFSPQSVYSSVYPVHIISEERIISQAATNLRDLMKTQLNVRINQDNILGSSMSINGISGQNIKVMVDGVPVIGRMEGNIDLSQINMNNVSKIEIIEGPMSTIYGSDALGGVVNIITQEAECERSEFDANGYYESIYQVNFDGNLRFNINKYNFLISGGRNFFGGYSTVDTSRNKQWNPKIQYFGNFKLGHDFKNLKAQYSLQYFNEFILNRGEPWLPYKEEAFDDEYRTNRLTSSLFLNATVGNYKYWNTLLDISYYNRKKNTYYIDLTTLHRVLSGNPEDQDTTTFMNYLFRTSYSWDNPASIFSYLIGTDLNYETDKGKRIEGNSKEIGDYAIYASIGWLPFSNLRIQPSVRFIYNTKYQAPIVPAFNIKWDIIENFALRASYAKGFRAPTLKELYFMFVDANHNIWGNPNLSAENSDSWNASLTYKIPFKNSIFDFGTSFFYNDIRNLITLAFIQDTKYANVNIGKYKTTGLNLTANYYTNNISLQTGFSYIGRYNDYSDTTNLPEFMYSPEFQANIIYKLPLWEIQLAAFYKYTGKMPGYGLSTDNKVAEYTIDDYNTLDISLNKSFLNNLLTLQIGGKNLFNVTSIKQNIATYEGTHSSGAVNMPIAWGRTFFVSLKVNVK